MIDRMVLLTILMWLPAAVCLGQSADTLAAEPVGAPATGGPVVRILIEDEAITPVTVRYVKRSFEESASFGAQAILIQLDTPGGLVQSTRTIVKEILSSRIPVIVFVAPSGSRAASAGVFITLAAHVAAMAPGTHIGAAHPVQLGGTSMQVDTTGRGVMEEKVVNDARAWARALADLRGRNSDWAELAVSESRSITSDSAAHLNVVDLVARDVDELLEKIDGRAISLENETVTLRTAGARLVPIDPWWGERLLGMISNPNVAFILLMLGFYGLLFEFYSPGWGVSGTVGALCLLLAFSGLAVLPINFVGLLLILVALGLFVAEAFIPSFGALTIGGVISLVLGGIMLVDSPTGVLAVSKTVVFPVAIATGLITVFLMTRIVKTHRQPVHTGSESMIGAPAVVIEDFVPSDKGYSGPVRTHGELWTGVSENPLRQGDSARIVAREGLRLFVRHET